MGMSGAKEQAGMWWHMFLVLAFWKQRPADLHEFKARLVYRVSSRPARAV